MTRDIFNSIDKTNSEEFFTKMGDFFIRNQEKLHKLGDENYKKVLQTKGDNESLKEAQKNIEEYYAILEISSNVIEYLSNNAHRIYLVYLDEFSDSSINILVYCFTKKNSLGLVARDQRGCHVSDYGDI